MTDADDRPFEIVTLPMPGVVGGTSTDSRNLDRLPASYANFYIANGVVLAPVFGHANDRRALKTLEELFPVSSGGWYQLRAVGLGHGDYSLRHPATTGTITPNKTIRRFRRLRRFRQNKATVFQAACAKIDKQANLVASRFDGSLLAPFVPLMRAFQLNYRNLLLTSIQCRLLNSAISSTRCSIVIFKVCRKIHSDYDICRR